MNRWIVAAGSLSLMIWICITAISYGLPVKLVQWIDAATGRQFTEIVSELSNGFYYDVRNNDMPTGIFLVLFFILFSLTTAVAIFLSRKTPKAYTLGIIIVFSVLFRIVALPGILIHENDMYRYMWDGKVALAGINPFKYSPADVFMYDNGYQEDHFIEETGVMVPAREFTPDDEANLDDLILMRDEKPVYYNRIGHKQVPTIYPPVAQALFMIPVAVNRYSLIVMKAFFVLFDLASLLLIIGLLAHFKKNTAMSVIYGWSPLVLFEIANGGHYDSIPIFFTLLAVYLFLKRQRITGIFALAASALAKLYAVILLPIIIRPLRWKLVMLFTALCISAYLPYILWDQTGIKGVYEGLRIYNDQWSYNSSFFALIYLILENAAPDMTHSLLPSKIIAGMLFLLWLAWLSLKPNKSDLDSVHKCFLATAGLFILNPVADPWYYCWVMPFLCLFPYKSWYLLSGLLALSYLNFHSDIGWIGLRYGGLSALAWATYTPFFLMLIFELFKRPKFAAE